MNRLFQILALTFLLSSCNKENKLDGIWYGAYSIIDGKKESLSETTLLEFKNDQLFTIKIRDLSTGELDKVTIDTSDYELTNSELKFKTYSPSIQFSTDTLALDFENKKLVLRRIPERLKNLNINADCFQGSYFIQSKNYQDSLDFVNDSLVIFTGEYDQNSPGKKWEIVNYNGFKLLNIHENFQPVLVIKSCNSNGINLIYPSVQQIDIKLTPTKSNIDKETLIGKWTEVENSLPPPPAPSNLTEKDLKFSIKINNDSFKIKKYGRIKTHNWGLTSDGKRIYFLDKFLENEGSWKLLDLTDSSMTVRLSSQSFSKVQIVKFKKENNINPSN